MIVATRVTPALEQIYAENASRNRPSAAHLPRLRALADGCALVVEFGVQEGDSSSALLMGAERVISYDIAETVRARQLAEAAPHWDYRIQSSLEAGPVECDGLFVDSFHTYAHCRAELDRHADSVRSWLAFHDIGTFGEVGGLMAGGRQSWDYSQHVGQTVPEEHRGIRPAIDELLIRDPSWRITARFCDSHGLLVLERAR
jgi:hypothetical protein